jgi:hypothetical protein
MYVHRPAVWFEQWQQVLDVPFKALQVADTLTAENGSETCSSIVPLLTVRVEDT